MLGVSLATLGIGARMTDRRKLLCLALLGGAFMPARGAPAGDCPAQAQAAASVLLDRYVAAVNAHDTGPFAELFTEAYIQHSGRSPSGLAAQVENLRRIFAVMPDVQMSVEDRIIAGD